MGLCSSKKDAAASAQTPGRKAKAPRSPPSFYDGGAVEKSVPQRKAKAKAATRSRFEFKEERSSSTMPVSPRVPAEEKDEALTGRLLKVLEALPLFSNLTDQTRQAVVQSLGSIPTDPGQVICSQDERCSYFYILEEGTFIISVDGSEVKEIGRGDSFGEESLLFDNALSFTVTSSGSGKMWVLDRITYQRVLVKTSTESAKSNSSFLSKVPILAPLDDAQMARLAEALIRRRFRAGDYIVRQGERGNTFYIVEKGEVAVIERSSIGKEGETEKEIKRRTTGWYFGEGALQSEKGVRNADVKAVTDTVCLLLDRESFNEILGSLHDLLALNFKKRLLRNVDLLKPLSDDQLELIVDSMQEVQFGDGEYICRQGDAGDMFYIIKEGHVRITTNSEDGEKEVGSLLVGDYFGEGSLLRDTPRRANVIAKGPVECFAINRDNFQAALGPLLRVLDDSFEQRRGTDRGNVKWEDLQKIQTIGSGSYGTVSIVRHKVTGETYALKRIRKSTVVAKRQQRFVQNERKILSTVDHPFLVNLVRTFKDEDSIYMLTEICLGGELYTLMKETVDSAEFDEDDEVPGCFDLKTCQFYTAVAILALEYLHNMGVIHRDVKPENLLLTADGYLKLADYGFAKEIGNMRTYSLCGTPEYTAPEVYKRSGHGRGADWWALGVLVYEMASGYSPFHVSSQNSWDCYVEISKYERSYPNVQFPSLFPEALVSFLLKMLHPNPNKRYGSRQTAKDMKKHPFFEGVDWTSLQDKKIKAPFKPPVNSVMDTSNFEEVEDRHGGAMTTTGKLGTSTFPWDKDF